MLTDSKRGQDHVLGKAVCVAWIAEIVFAFPCLIWKDYVELINRKITNRRMFIVSIISLLQEEESFFFSPQSSTSSHWSIVLVVLSMVGTSLHWEVKDASDEA